MEHNLAKLISKSRKQITILFTDIEGSTKHWESKGDIEGRIMIDQHNRLAFPVIRKYRGKVIKTIGDSIMASFKSPKNAIKAAIGIQQAIEQHKEKNKRFKLKIRIGIHTGKALVEKNDVFGDVVNVAARVEGVGKGGDIMVSARTANLVKHNEFALKKKTSFVPKGKSRSITVYRSDWKKVPSLISKINFDSALPVLARNKLELFVYSLSSLGILYYIFHEYARYLIADHKLAFILAFNPQQIVTEHPVVVGLIVAAIFAVAVFIKFLTVIPYFLFRAVKGGFGFAVVLLLANLIFSNMPNTMQWNINTVISESKHLFVEVQENDSSIYLRPDNNSKKLKNVSGGELLLLADVLKSKGITWNKVLISDAGYGWIQRVVPPRMGVPEKRVTIANKFYLKWKHVYALVLAIIGFIWGYFNFTIKPT